MSGRDGKSLTGSGQVGGASAAPQPMAARVLINSPMIRRSGISLLVADATDADAAAVAARDKAVEGSVEGVQ